jgi:hypothetical protein
MGAQPEHRAQNPRRGGHGDQEGHGHGPEGPRANASGSSVHDVQQPPCFLASNDIVRYTTRELLDVAAQYTTNKEASSPLPVPGEREAIPGNSRAAPSNITIQGTMKDVKGGR